MNLNNNYLEADIKNVMNSTDVGYGNKEYEENYNPRRSKILTYFKKKEIF